MRIRLWAMVMALLLPLLLCTCAPREEITLNIVLPKVGNVQNINTNHYKLWLEEQSGYNIVFSEVSSGYDRDYIARTLSDSNIKTDIIFFGEQSGNYTLLESDEVMQMTEYFLPLDDYITADTTLHDIFSEYEEYGWREFLSSDDGKLYFIPSVNPSRSAKNGQSLWINTAWLHNLGVDIPTTTEQFREVLTAFRTQDANGNGITDEIPLAGSLEHYDTMSYNAIINAFVYYDPTSYGFYAKNNELYFSPSTEQFRRALIYLNSLYADGLLHPLQFSLDDDGLTALATDPVDILGVFSASHLSDVFAESDSNRFSHFTHLAPLQGEVQGAVSHVAVPMPVAAISANTTYPDEAFNLLDLMLSDEGFLVALYGEEGVDWEHALPTDVDIFGNVAQIATINPVNISMQNKNFDGIGAMFYYPEYVDGVRYTDYDIGYFNARALLANEPYFGQSDIGLSILKLIQLNPDLETHFSELDHYTQQNTRDFIVGDSDIFDDTQWESFVAGYEQFDDLFSGVRKAVIQ